jgi:hypothetical protein
MVLGLSLVLVGFGGLLLLGLEVALVLRLVGREDRFGVLVLLWLPVQVLELELVERVRLLMTRCRWRVRVGRLLCVCLLGRCWSLRGLSCMFGFLVGRTFWV